MRNDRSQHDTVLHGRHRTATGRAAALVLVLALVLAACNSATKDPLEEFEPVDEPPTPTAAVWHSQDVGAVGGEGVTVLAPNGAPSSVRATGRDVWGTADAFRFVYRELDGNGSLTVRVDDIVAAGAWTKAGVMIREDLAPGARNAFLLLTDGHGAVMQARTERDGSTSDERPGGGLMHDPTPTAPWWLRIQRADGEIVGYHSQDGNEWTEVGRVAIDLGARVLVGTAVSSHDDLAQAEATFGDATVTRDGGGEPTDGSGTGQQTTTVRYEADGSDFPNPERGLYVEGDPSKYAGIAADGYRLAMRYVRLDSYRYGGLPGGFLDDLRDDFASARGSGVKLIVRFAYNRSRDVDAPIDTVLRHIEQLSPVLREYSDVIAVVQAGFVGAWGEWHTSTNGLTAHHHRKAIVDALLDAVPRDRMIQVRYPYYGRDMFPTPPDAGSAFDGSDRSRVGQLNDCFLTNGGDGGTYIDDEDRAYVERVTPYTVMGGETCSLGGLGSRNDGHVAVEETDRYHWDYLNDEFYTGVLNKWRDQGYYDDVVRNLGYRYTLVETTTETTGTPGQTLDMVVTIRNDGNGKLYNPRPLDVVLVPHDGGERITLRAHDDARTVLPLSDETREVAISVQLPTRLAPGGYDVHVALPDASSTLARDARYAIRLANVGTWNAGTGTNDLGADLTVSPYLATHGD